ncbi:MAG: DUF1501 domain-containing protein [Planctomycetota bacterium]|nr:MAG: DUF1501 domain-containing protein [Planctomycetota bacterium]
MSPLPAHSVSRRAALGLGAGALAWLLQGPRLAARPPAAPRGAPRARRLIYLYMSGAPSQIDLWDYKPRLADLHDTDLPDSVRQGQRITTMTSGQARFPVAASRFAFARHGRSGTWVSELLPHTARIVDELAVIRSLHTEAINHEPAINYMMTGAEQPGRPCLGAWLSYGLGCVNQDLPAFVVLLSSWSGPKVDQPLYSRLWGAGFLPSEHQGVALRSQGDPVLYLSNPDGVSPAARRRQLDDLAALNALRAQETGDPEARARAAQHELAFRMQSSVPELADISREPAQVLESYGPDVSRPGSFARNCLLARRLAERGVRCVQVYHRGWDQHRSLNDDLPRQCRDVDQPCAALIADLKQRGMLDDTLVVWGTEFGRTAYSQGNLQANDWGRDHHPRCFTVWLAGGGIRGGLSHGATDDFSYNITADPVHVHDLNATILHCLGIDHERLTYRHQGRDFRLTDVHGRVVTELLA